MFVITKFKKTINSNKSKIIKYKKFGGDCLVKKRRRQEESFRIKSPKRRYSTIWKNYRKRSKKTAVQKLKNRWNKLTEGWIGGVIYVLLGVGLALLTKQVLAAGLSTDMPVVAVVSSSMQHNNAEATYYDWLGENLGYDKSYINSWPITGGFMVGDMPIVKGQEKYEVGDVIVYSVPGQKYPIIHRIIKINEDGSYQTKGDNNMAQLPYELHVTDDQIYGKVVFVIPKLGYFKVLLTKLLGIL